jgi:cobalt-zinc-cadmium efflux system outer membrane protein
MIGLLCINKNILADEMNLDQIMEKVRENNFELSAHKEQIKASDALIKQADKNPNPELEVELENFGKNEIGIGVGQSIELGGRRKRRVEIATLEADIAKQEYNAKKLEIEAEAYRRILPILAVSNKIQVLETAVLIAENTRDLIQQRVDVGAANQIDVVRVEIELDELMLEMKKANREYDLSLRNLTYLWSAEYSDLVNINCILNSNIELENKATLLEMMWKQPAYTNSQIEKKIKKLELLDINKSVIPDLGVSAGFIRNNEEENAFSIGASIELPLFNRNQGERRSVEHSLKAFDYEVRNLSIEKESQLNELYSQIKSVEDELNTLVNSILPKAENIFQTILSFYGNGSVSLLEVIETQAELIEYNNRIIDLQISKAELLVDLYELTGWKADIIMNK